MIVSLCWIKHSRVLHLHPSLHHYFLLSVITCSKAPENATVTEGGVAGLTVECSGTYDFDFTLLLDTMDGSAVGEC